MQKACKDRPRSLTRIFSPAFTVRFLNLVQRLVRFKSFLIGLELNEANRRGLCPEWLNKADDDNEA